MLRRIALAATLVLAVLPAAAQARGRDRNHDRIPDRWERVHHLSLHVNQAGRDQDRDGLANLGEFRHHTDPRKADSDQDGLDDGAEMEVGDDPRDSDSDDDGIRDGEENAGTVQSFDGTTLTIALASGDTVSGIVDSTTEIKCEDSATATASSHGGDDPSGDDHGSGGGGGTDDPPTHDAGDDNGGGTTTTSCGADALTPGAVVHEAELDTVGGQAVWHEVKLN